MPQPLDLYYFALIGDVVNSRGIEQRQEFQDRFLEAVRRMNLEHKGSLASPAELIRGDEVQALLRHPDAVVPTVRDLSQQIFPYRITFGLGYGTLSTRILPHTYHIDGPVFHHAREALTQAKRERVWLKAQGFGEPTDQLIDTLFQLMHSIRSRWTPTQAKYVREARHKLLKEVAEELGRSPSTIHQSLRAASFEAIKEGESAVGVLLAYFEKNTSSE